MDDNSSPLARGGVGFDEPALIEPLPTLQMAPRPSSTQRIVGSAVSWMSGAPRPTSLSPWTTYSPPAPLVPLTASGSPSPTFALRPTRGRVPPRPTSTSSTSHLPSTTLMADRDSDEPSVSVIIPRISSTSRPRPTASSTFETSTSPDGLSSTESQSTESSLTLIEPLRPTRTRTTKTITSTSSATNSAIPPPASLGGASADNHGTENPASFNKTSGATIGGIAGGISAAILLALLAFLFWKLRRRRERSLDKRSSFDPYGNGIDASRGGLLVESVPYKPDDQSSGKETLYSDDQSPTRYQQSARTSLSENLPVTNTTAGTPSTPAAPAVPHHASYPYPSPAPVPAVAPMPIDPPHLVYSGPTPPMRRSPPDEPFREPFPSYVPDPSMSAYLPRPLRPHHGRPHPQLYNRRRPPVPPSMRRTRTPMHRIYDNSYPPRPNLVSDEGILSANAMESGGVGFAGPYPSNLNVLRSNSMQGYYQPRSADLARIERNRRVQRSASVDSMNRGPYGSYQNYRPMPEGPYQGVTRPSSRQQRGSHPMQHSGQQPQGYYEDYSHQQPQPGMMMRDPISVASQQQQQHEQQQPQIDLVQRATNNNHGSYESQHGPQHAAKNF